MNLEWNYYYFHNYNIYYCYKHYIFICRVLFSGHCRPTHFCSLCSLLFTLLSAVYYRKCVLFCSMCCLLLTFFSLLTSSFVITVLSYAHCIYRALLCLFSFAQSSANCALFCSLCSLLLTVIAACCGSREWGIMSPPIEVVCRPTLLRLRRIAWQRAYPVPCFRIRNVQFSYAHGHFFAIILFIYSVLRRSSVYAAHRLVSEALHVHEYN